MKNFPEHLGYIYEIQHSYCPIEQVESNYIMRQLQRLCETYGDESPECNLPEYPKQKEDLDIVSDPFKLETFGLDFALVPCRVTG